MSNSDPNIVNLLVKLSKSSLAVAKTLYPEIFYAKFDPIHLEMADVIDGSHYGQKRGLASPRGIGKTSLVNLAKATQQALLGDKRYIVPISATNELAVQQSENLKWQIRNNENIQAIFGDVTVKEEFTKDKWVIRKPDGREVCIFPRGAGQQIRGQNWRGFRPDLPIIDDLEDPKEVNNERLRQQKYEWLNADVLKSIDPRSRDWEIIMIGTILHQDSILQRILDDPSWYTKRLEICDDDFNTNAPSLYSKEDLEAMFEEHKQQGIIEVFFREMRNIASPTGEYASFQKEYFKYYNEAEENLYLDQNLETVVIIDPAKTVNTRSAESAVVTISISTTNRKIYIRDVQRGKWHPDELFNRVDDAVRNYKASLVGIEVTGLGEFALHPLKNTLVSKGNFVEIIELHARAGTNEKGKVERIKTLIPYYRQGHIYHNDSGICQDLELQLLSFPSAKYWDVMDATAYIIEILEKGGRYMSWFVQGAGTDPESNTDVDILKELEQDFFADQPLGDWRVI
jgi:predicted phage terminase large subunit-like protein